MKFKILTLTTTILLPSIILGTVSPCLSQEILDDVLLAEKLEIKDISPKILISQRKSWEQFKRDLGQREGRGRYSTPNTLNFIGKYQFGEGILQDLGYFIPSGQIYNGGQNGIDKNYWRGRWTGKNGINRIQDFLGNNNNVQEIAIEEAFKIFWGRIRQNLSIGDYLGGRVGGVRITCSGILAAAHLRGEYGVINLLRYGYVSRDEYNTSILTYLNDFSGYQTPYCR